MQNIRQHLLRHVLKKVLERLCRASTGSTPESVPPYILYPGFLACLTLVLALLDTSKALWRDPAYEGFSNDREKNTLFLPVKAPPGAGFLSR